jgi:hypothetical protein
MTVTDAIIESFRKWDRCYYGRLLLGLEGEREVKGHTVVKTAIGWLVDGNLYRTLGEVLDFLAPA